MNHLEHPLKVYNPAAGIHFLLQWWSHNEQSQIIVARSEKALHPVFKHICEENPDGRVERVLEVEFVAPSDEMCRRANEYRRRENVAAFLTTVVWEAKDVHRYGFPLPSKFQICTKYSPSPEYVSEGESPSDFAIEEHYECLNCCNGIILTDETPESLYNKYWDAWAKVNNKTTCVDVKAAYSRARKAKADEKIWAARPDFGHHCGGVSLNVITPIPTEPSEIGSIPTQTILFYFQLRMEMDKSPWQQQMDDAKRKLIQQKEKEDAAWQTARIKTQNEEAFKFLKIFSEEKS